MCRCHFTKTGVFIPVRKSRGVIGMARYFVCFVLFCLLVSTQAYARNVDGHGGPVMLPPRVQHKSHTVGNMRLFVSNWASVGLSGSDLGPWGCEFPKYSEADYLYIGAVWIGAIADGETLVSVGVDGALLENNFFPGSSPEDTIIERSCDPWSPYYDPQAVSEQDLIAIYTDTVGEPYNHPDHTPLGIKVTQQSYAWSHPQGGDFVYINFWIENIGTQFLADAYFGLYMDPDCTPVTYDFICRMLRMMLSVSEGGGTNPTPSGLLALFCTGGKIAPMFSR